MAGVLEGASAAGHLVHDAHIAALCLEHGVSELLTAASRSAAGYDAASRARWAWCTGPPGAVDELGSVLPVIALWRKQQCAARTRTSTISRVQMVCSTTTSQAWAARTYVEESRCAKVPPVLARSIGSHRSRTQSLTGNGLPGMSSRRVGQPPRVLRRARAPRPVAQPDRSRPRAGPKRLGGLEGRMKIRRDLVRVDTVKDWEMPMSARATMRAMTRASGPGGRR